MDIGLLTSVVSIPVIGALGTVAWRIQATITARKQSEIDSLKTEIESIRNIHSEQMSLMKVLHKRQKDLKEKATGYTEQKANFANLLKLLECKARSISKKREEKKKKLSTDIAMLEEGARAGGSSGGANVMKL